MCINNFFDSGNPAERGILRWRKQLLRQIPTDAAPKDAYSFESVTIVKQRPWFRYIPFLVAFDQKLMNVPSLTSLIRRIKPKATVQVTPFAEEDDSGTHTGSTITSVRRNPRGKSRKAVMFKADDQQIID